MIVAPPSFSISVWFAKKIALRLAEKKHHGSLPPGASNERTTEMPVKEEDVLKEHDKLPFSQLDPINVTLLAPSGGGKTSVAFALHYALDRVLGANVEFACAPTSKTLNPMELVTYGRGFEPHRAYFDLGYDEGNTTSTAAYFNVARPGDTPYKTYCKNHTTGARFVNNLGATDAPYVLTYAITGAINGGDRMNLSILDYPGRVAAEGAAGDPVADALNKRLMQSFLLIVPIDAVCAVELDRLDKSLQNADDQAMNELNAKAGHLRGRLAIDAILKYIMVWVKSLESQKTDGMLVFAPFKCESFMRSTAGREQLKNAIMSLYWHDGREHNGFDGTAPLFDRIRKQYSQCSLNRVESFRRYCHDHLSIFYAPIQTYGRVILANLGYAEENDGIDTSLYWHDDDEYTPNFVFDPDCESSVSGALDIFKEMFIQRNRIMTKLLNRLTNGNFSARVGHQLRMLRDRIARVFGGRGDYAEFVVQQKKFLDDMQVQLNRVEKANPLDTFAWPDSRDVNITQEEVSDEDSL